MPTNVQDDLNTAIGYHQQGLLDQATRVYQRVLAQEPDQPDALHLLGVAAHQQGDHRRAIELIGRAVALRPSVAVFHANMAEAYRALRQYDRAVGCCRTALRLQPGYAEAANHYGLAVLDQGKVEEAVAQFQNAVRLKPDFAMAHNNLGNALRLHGQREQAIAEFREALRHDPNLAEAHSNLGQMLLEQRELEEALGHVREAVRLRPNFPEAHNNLGNVLRERGELTEAKACYAEALRINPDLALTYSNMAQALQEEGKFDEAVTWYQQALDLEPNSARIHVYLAGVYEEQENYEEAIARYDIALRLDPNYAPAHNGLGWARQEMGHLTEALEHFRTALRLEADFPAAQHNLANALQEMGDLKAAEQSFRDLLKTYPKHAGAWSQLATLLRGKLPEADSATMTRLLDDPDMGEGGRMNLHFGLAQVYDGVGDYAKAGEHLRLGNALQLETRKKKNQAYDPEDHARFVDNLIAVFSEPFFARTRGFGLDSERPVFIVGLPRSGTTLTEQVLASHSKVFGAGELRVARQDFEHLADARNDPGHAFEHLAALDRGRAREVAQQHLDELLSLHRTAVRVVDKMPDNYLQLGLLAVLFPRARFIHCRRDLRDTAVSCWMTHFRHIRWANDPEHIATRFREYQRLMAHWKTVLAVPVLEVEYEDTVADLEGVARRLVDWCGLAWEPGCLAFHESKRPVRTASVTQVRQPIYSRSVARWKNYEADLGALFARLAGKES
jgi:tetratricopeptide (TPR) repeat protein